MRSISTILILIGFICFSSIIVNAQIQLGNDFNGEQANDRAGHSVAFSNDGNRIAISSPGFDDNTGRVQVFESENDEWVQLGNDIIGYSTNQYFGETIALSGDGNRLVIAALDDYYFIDEYIGQISVHEWNGEEWLIVNPDIEGMDFYSSLHENIEVVMSEDGNHIVMATNWGDNSEQDGWVMVYERSGNEWITKGDILSGIGEFNDFGASINISADGSNILIGDPLENFGFSDDLGAIRSYEWQDSAWAQRGQTIRGAIPESEIGTFSALSPDGNYLIYSERNVDFLNNFFIVKVLKWNGDSWAEYGAEFMPFPDSQSIIGDFLRVDISSDGNVIAIADPQQNTSGSQQGRITIHQKAGNEWLQVGEMISGTQEDDYLGSQLILSNDGKRLAAGSTLISENGENSGQVKVFSLESITAIDNVIPFEINVYPNPTNGIIELNNIAFTKILVFNNMGQLVKKIINPEKILDISDLRNGLYYMEAHSKEGFQTIKVMKQ